MGHGKIHEMLHTVGLRRVYDYLAHHRLACMKGRADVDHGPDAIHGFVQGRGIEHVSGYHFLDAQALQLGDLLRNIQHSNVLLLG